MAAELTGETPEALEADAAAKAAIISMFTPRRLDDPPPEAAEPPIELPPRDKPLADYTPEESEAVYEKLMRGLRERDRKAEEERAREEAEANRTEDQRLGDWIADASRPDAKRARNAEFLRSLGMLGEQ